jgi:hypothetical protein
MWLDGEGTALIPEEGHCAHDPSINSHVAVMELLYCLLHHPFKCILVVVQSSFDIFLYFLQGAKQINRRLLVA